MKIHRGGVRFFWIKKDDQRTHPLDLSPDLIEKTIKVKCMVDQHKFYGDDLRCPCGDRQTIIVK